MQDNELGAYKTVTDTQKMEEAKKKKQLQNSMIISIVSMIILLSFFAALYPTFNGDSARMEYVFFGVVVGFLIILLLAKGVATQRREIPQKMHAKSDKKGYRHCPKCGRAIAYDVNVCPYCEKNI